MADQDSEEDQDDGETETDTVAQQEEGWKGEGLKDEHQEEKDTGAGGRGRSPDEQDGGGVDHRPPAVVVDGDTAGRGEERKGAEEGAGAGEVEGTERSPAYENGQSQPAPMVALDASLSTATEGDAVDGRASSTLSNTPAVATGGAAGVIVAGDRAPVPGGVVQDNASAAAATAAAAHSAASSAAAASAAAASAVKKARERERDNQQQQQQASRRPAPSRASFPSAAGQTKPAPQGRATSLSPPRSAVSGGFKAGKPGHRPNARSAGRSALRAWADAASEDDPWDLPAPLELDKLPTSKPATTTAAFSPASALAALKARSRSSGDGGGNGSSNANGLGAGAGGTGAGVGGAAGALSGAASGGGKDEPEKQKEAGSDGCGPDAAAAAAAAGAAAAAAAATAPAEGALLEGAPAGARGASPSPGVSFVREGGNVVNVGASPSALADVVADTDATGGGGRRTSVGGNSIQDEGREEHKGEDKVEARHGHGNGSRSEAIRRGSGSYSRVPDGREGRPPMSSPNSRKIQLHRSARFVEWVLSLVYVIARA